MARRRGIAGAALTGRGWLIAVAVTAGLCAGLLRAQEAARQSLTDRLPAGRTLVYAELRGLTELSRALGPTALGRWREQLRPFLDALWVGFAGPRERFSRQLEEQTGVSLGRWLGLLEGGVEVGLVLPARDEHAEPAGPPQPIAVLSVAARHGEVLDAVLARSEGGPPVERVTLGDRLALVIGAPAAAALAAEGEAPLSGDPSFSTVRARVWGEGQGLGLVYVGTGRLADALLAADEPQRAVLDKLGLLGIRGLGMGLAVERGQLREAIALAHPEPPRGLVAMLTGRRDVDVMREADRVPAAARGVTVIALSPATLWKEGLDLIASIEPEARERIEDGLLEAEARLGFSPGEDLFGVLGGPITIEAIAPAGGLELLPDAVISFGLKDAARLEHSLELLAGAFEYEVKTIEDPTGGAPVRYLSMRLGKLGQDPARGYGEDRLGVAKLWSSLAGAWTIEGDRVRFAAMPQTLLDRRRRLRPSLAELEAFKQVLADTGGRARLFSLNHTRRGVGALYHVALRLLHGFEPALRRAGIAVETARLPGPAAFTSVLGPSSVVLQVGDGAIALVSRGSLPILSLGGGVSVGAAVAVLAGRNSSSEAPPPSARAEPPAHRRSSGVWSCPMHPKVRASEPGPCPICGMSMRRDVRPPEEDR